MNHNTPNNIKPAGIQYQENYKETGIPGVTWATPLEEGTQCVVYINNVPSYTVLAKDGGCAFNDPMKRPIPGDILIIRAFNATDDQWSDPYTVPGTVEGVKPKNVQVVLNASKEPVGLSWTTPANDRVVCYPETAMVPIGERIISAIKECKFNKTVYAGQNVRVVGVKLSDNTTEKSDTVRLPVWGERTIPGENESCNSCYISSNRLYWKGDKLGATGGGSGVSGVFYDIGLVSVFSSYSACKDEGNGYYSVPVPATDIPTDVPFRFAIATIPGGIQACSSVFHL